MYDKNGRLTRAGAVQVIQLGGSVAHAGKIYASLDTLPDEATFAKGDPQQEAAAKAALEKTIADAQRQLETLNAPPAPVAEKKDPSVQRSAGKTINAGEKTEKDAK